MKHQRADVMARIVEAQDDGDSVMLPNACRSQLVEWTDEKRVRCFSLLTRQPHIVPPHSWSVIETPSLPPVKEVDDVDNSHIVVDHVTRAIIGNNAVQYITGTDGTLDYIRLLSPGEGPADAHWEAQAASMIE